MKVGRKEDSVVAVAEASKHRYADGWRRGRPEEDPGKLKRWGFVQAKPSEFLIKMRAGQVVRSGQGATTFKWPWESVAVVPTTVQRLHFRADQVTVEKVGVEVTGLAVWRIAEPTLAFRVVNFSYPERAQEKLAQMLEEMFMGAARRLVANLTVEQCLSRRKEGLATELLGEIQPVVGGHGRLEDRTHRGWGVVIDTIEIQDVRVQSAAVFAAMQARYRQDQLRQAREAELARERAVRSDEAASERQVELARVAAQREVSQQRLLAGEQGRLDEIASEARVVEAKLAQERLARQHELEVQRELALAKLASDAELRERRRETEERAALEALAATAREADARIAHERAEVAARQRADLEKVQLEAQLDALRRQAQCAAARSEAEQLRAMAEVLEARLALEVLELRRATQGMEQSRLELELEQARLRGAKEVENLVSPGLVQLAVAQRLPELAAAFQQQMGTVHVTAVDGANPFGYVAAAVRGVLDLARSAGVPLPAAGGDLDGSVKTS